MELNLIFASFTEFDTSSSDIETLFIRSGYNVVFSDFDKHLQDNTNENKVLVVSMQASSLHIEKLKKLLNSKSNSIPCFCILHCHDYELNINLLEYCYDFAVWPCPPSEIFFRLNGLISKPTYIEQNKSYNNLKNTMIGESSVFKKVLKRIELFSRCDAPVLIEGATGTGKEMVARAIHYQSERKDYPFIPVNCGALPDSLIENELFGHEKGAYTDAKSCSKGLVGQANGGTLFLDEIESLSLKGQVALLRLLQEDEYKPLGSNTPIKSNIRIISATNVSLKKLTEKGIIRQDLYYRLNILSVVLPPLRERGQDVVLLAEFFLKKFQKKYHSSEKNFVQDALTWIKKYSWPGNVRELETCIHRAFIISDSDSLRVQYLQEPEVDFIEKTAFSPANQDIPTSVSFKEAKSNVIKTFEKCYLRELMQKSEGNVTLAAKTACKERRAFGKLLKKHGIERMAYITSP